MKLKYFLPLAAAALPVMLQARPADARLQTAYNPDGTVVDLRLQGDEFFSYYTDASGSVVLEKDAKGFWTPAMRLGRQMTTSLEDLQLMRSEQYDKISRANVAAYGTPHRMAARDDEGRTVFPTLGDDIRGLVVLIEWSDVPFSIPNTKEAYEKMISEPGYSDYDGVGCVQDYFEACSNGLFKPKFDVWGPVTLPKTQAYYLAKGEDSNKVPNPGKTGLCGEAFATALTWLHENTDIDFSHYDYDKDGVIDNVYFFYSGYGQADAPAGKKDCIWPHQQDYNQYVKYYPNLGWETIEYDGVKFGPYACSNELKGSVAERYQPYMDGIGAFCHEFSHVLGLPDFYDTANGNTVTPGSMDILAMGSYNRNSTQPPLFGSYSKWVCRWMEYIDAEEGQSYEVDALSKGGRAVRIRLPRRNKPDQFFPYEYYLIEARDLQGWDASNPDRGLMVWHVRYNENLWQTNKVNSYGDPHLYIMKPDTSNDTFGWGHSGRTYIYPEGEVSLTVNDFNNSDYKAYVTDMLFDDATSRGTFDYNVITATPDDVTVMQTPTLDPSGERMVTLHWDPVEGATGYILNVWREKSTGARTYINGLENWLVEAPDGNYLIDYWTSAEWKATVYAQVQVVKGLPSSKVSNRITFCPNEMSSGVEDVLAGGEAAIYGLAGEVVAPEGAKVYNMSGMQVGRQGLAAGIYLVRYKDQAVKVMVK